VHLGLHHSSSQPPTAPLQPATITHSAAHRHAGTQPADIKGNHHWRGCPVSTALEKTASCTIRIRSGKHYSAGYE